MSEPMLEFGNDTLVALAVVAGALLLVFIVVEYFIYEEGKNVATLLTLAERDFNANVAGGLAHGGRKDRVKERHEWNQMVLPGETPALGAPDASGGGFGGIQYNQAGYRSVAHELIAANEKELSGKGATMGKAAITAFLLRELYEGNVDAAQQKIIAETRNNADRKPPYIAPGLDVLIGIEKFDPQELCFEEGAGVNTWLLKRVVKYWGFPRDIRWVKTDEDGTKRFFEPMEALGQLYQQNI